VGEGVGGEYCYLEGTCLLVTFYSGAASSGPYSYSPRLSERMALGCFVVNWRSVTFCVDFEIEKWYNLNRKEHYCGLNVR